MDDDAPTGRWMTYDEIAVTRGIKRSGAVRLVQRQKWRRQAGNDGYARVLVPHDELRPVSRTRPRPDHPPLGGGDGGGDVAPTISAALAALETALAEANKRGADALALADRLGMQLADAGERVDAAEIRTDRAEARAEELRRDLDAARVIAGAAQHDAQAARVEAQKAQDAAEELRKEKKEARKARGRLHRAWDGWRGR